MKKVIMDYKNYMMECLKDDKDRIRHTLNVNERAKELGIIYKADLNVLNIASLLHDITKNKSDEFHIDTISNIEFIKDTPKEFWHAESAKVIAQNIGIKNNKILEAIQYHIYGKINMSIETLILVIADYTEKGRTNKYSKDVYNLALKNLYEAYLYMQEKTFLHLKEMNIKIDQKQLEVYNYYKRRIKDK